MTFEIPGNSTRNGEEPSFLHTMKVEAIHGERFATREEMRHPIIKYTQMFCNLCTGSLLSHKFFQISLCGESAN
jgi:hypothetical protein